MAALCASFLMFGFVLTDGAGFTSIGGHHQVEVFEKKDAPAIELAAVEEIEAPPATVEAVLLDYGSHPRIIARLAESRIVGRSPGELLVYQHLKLPVIKDRDFTLRVTWAPGEVKGLRFAIVADRGPAANDYAVRMSLMEGRWDLVPLRDGAATRATYHVKIDFAGSVPRWMVARGAAKDLPSLYEGVRRLAAERRSGVVAHATRHVR